MKELEPGIYPATPYSVYDSWSAIRKSRLWTLWTRTPAHYKWELENPIKVETPAMRLGTAVHVALLEPETFDSRYAIGGPINPNTGKCYGPDTQKYAAWAEEQGKPTLTTEHADLCHTLAAAVHAHRVAQECIEGSQHEVCAIWTDAETGYTMKSRMDMWWVGRRLIVDAKTCRSAAPWPFAADAYRFGYHFQMAMYRDGMRALGFPDTKIPCLIAIEKDPPYAVAVYQFDEGAMDIGREQYRQALRRLVECEKSGVWPAYSENVEELILPRWAGTETAPAMEPTAVSDDDDDDGNALGII